MAKPEVRILACMNCKTVQPMPDFDGPAEYDEILAAAVALHESAGVRHTGQLFRVEEEKWDNHSLRESIIKQIQSRLDPSSTTGLDSAAYAMASNFKDDAMECWGRHLRTPACPDYKTEAKRLVPDTAAERKELGLSPAREYDRENRSITKHLCDYCPVHSMVQQHLREKAGLYAK